eukprot:gb/GECG01014265.1/.p1 GENE.gb/GECG01014265.1/~~gb/GECG01014265.1/.p1  ORF type:complete len:1771 (+),score=270.08 gb/GECG01014265.1/:1-5313(+)
MSKKPLEQSEWGQPQRPLSPSFYASSSRNKRQSSDQAKQEKGNDRSSRSRDQFDPPPVPLQPLPSSLEEIVASSNGTGERNYTSQEYYEDQQGHEEEDLLMEDMPEFPSSNAEDIEGETAEQMNTRIQQILEALNNPQVQQQQGNLIQQYLDQIQGILVGKKRISAHQFSEWWDQVVELRTNEQPKVRKWIASLVEEVCREKVEWIPRVIEPLLTLAEDQDQEVVQRVAAVTNNILRKAMRITVIDPYSGHSYRSQVSSEIQNMWKRFVQLREKLFGALTDANTSDGVRSAVIKLIETTIFTQTRPSKESVEKISAASKTGAVAAQVTGSDAFTLDHIPSNSTMHKKADLKKEADRLMLQLLRLLDKEADLTSGLELTHKTYADVIKTVTWVASRRPKDPLVVDTSIIDEYLRGGTAKADQCYVYFVTSYLHKFIYDPPSHMKLGRRRGISLLPRLTNSVKVGFLELLKLRCVRKEEEFEQVATMLGECLTDLGSGGEVEKHLGRKIEGKVGQIGDEEEEEEKYESDEKSIEGLKAINIPENRYSAQSYLQLAFDDRVNCIVQNFAYMPEGTPTPPDEIISSAAECLVMARLNTSSKHNVEEERSQLFEHPPLDLAPSDGGTHLAAVLQMVSETCTGEEIPSRARRVWEEDEISSLYSSISSARKRRTVDKDVKDGWDKFLDASLADKDALSFGDEATSNTQESIDKLGNKIETLKAEQRQAGTNSLISRNANSSTRMPGIPSNILSRITTALKLNNGSVCPGIDPILMATRKAFVDAERSARAKLKEEKELESKAPAADTRESTTIVDEREGQSVSLEKDLLMKKELSTLKKKNGWKFSDRCFTRILQLADHEWMQTAAQSAIRKYASILGRQATNPSGVVLYSFLEEFKEGGDKSERNRFGKYFCQSRLYRLGEIVKQLKNSKYGPRKLEKMSVLPREMCLGVLFAEYSLGHFISRNGDMERIAFIPPKKSSSGDENKETDEVRISSPCCTPQYGFLVETFVGEFVSASLHASTHKREFLLDSLKVILLECPQLENSVFDMVVGASLCETGSPGSYVSLLTATLENRPSARRSALEALMSIAFSPNKGPRTEAILSLCRRVVKIKGQEAVVVPRTEELFDTLKVTEDDSSSENAVSSQETNTKELIKNGASAMKDLSTLSRKYVRDVSDATRRLQLYFLLSTVYPSQYPISRFLEKIIGTYIDVMQNPVSSKTSQQVRAAVSKAYENEIPLLIRTLVKKRGGPSKMVERIASLHCIQSGGVEGSSTATDDISDKELHVLTFIIHSIVENRENIDKEQICSYIFQKLYNTTEIRCGGSLATFRPAIPGLKKSDIIGIVPGIMVLEDRIQDEIVGSLCSREGSAVSEAELFACMCSTDEVAKQNDDSESSEFGGVSLLKTSLEECGLAKWNPALPLSSDVVEHVITAYLKKERRHKLSAKSILDGLTMLIEAATWPRIIVKAIELFLQQYADDIDQQEVVDLLHKMVDKEVWKYSTLWSGFVNACKRGIPASLLVLCRLPVAELEKALGTNKVLHQRVRECAEEENNQKRISDEVLHFLSVKLKIDREALAREEQQQREQQDRLMEAKRMAEERSKQQPAGRPPNFHPQFPHQQPQHNQQTLFPGHAHARMPPPPGFHHPHYQMHGNGGPRPDSAHAQPMPRHGYPGQFPSQYPEHQGHNNHQQRPHRFGPSPNQEYGGPMQHPQYPGPRPHQYQGPPEGEARPSFPNRGGAPRAAPSHGYGVPQPPRGRGRARPDNQYNDERPNKSRRR